MFDFILGIAMVIAGFVVIWTIGCVTFKICFKIGDLIFGK